MIGSNGKTAHDWPLFYYGMAVGFTVMAAVGFYRFFIAGEETNFVWYQLFCIPWSAYWWAITIHHTVAPRLERLTGLSAAVIFSVGAYRTGSWLLISSVVIVAAYLIWEAWRYLRARDGGS